MNVSFDRRRFLRNINEDNSLFVDSLIGIARIIRLVVGEIVF